MFRCLVAAMLSKVELLVLGYLLQQQLAEKPELTDSRILRNAAQLVA